MYLNGMIFGVEEEMIIVGGVTELRVKKCAHMDCWVL